MNATHTTRVIDDIEFAYRDSGAPPNKADYFTVVVFHGHTFHSGEHICLRIFRICSPLYE